MAVGVDAAGTVGLMLPGHPDVFECGPDLALAMAKALIAAAQAAQQIRDRNAAGKN